MKSSDPPYRQIIGSEQKPQKNAISICLFKSIHYQPSKHIKPLQSFLTEGIPKDYDLLVFCEEVFVPLFKPQRGLHVFVVNDTRQKFARHLWRYYGADFFNVYEHVWFRGADTPDPRNRLLEKAAELIKAEVICWPRLWRRFYEFMGQCRLSKRPMKSLATYLETVTNADEELWTVDEKILSDWWFHNMNLFRTVIVLSKELSIEPARKYLNHLLTIGRQTLVVKNESTQEPISTRWL